MLSKFFINRPRFALVISIVMTLAGLIAINVLPVAQYPPITPPQVSITTSYPGASADVVEKTVVEPIETQVNGVKRMLYMSSTSSNDGLANINVTFEIGSDGDMNTVNVQNRVSIALPQLPEEVKRQGVTVKEKSPNMLMIVNLYSPDDSWDGLALSNYAMIHLRDAILRINGIGDVKNLSGIEYSMRIWLDPDRLASMGLTASDVISAVKEQNVQAAAGQVGASPSPNDQQLQYTLRVEGRLSEVSEFENIIIRANPDGSMVKLEDVARVQLGSKTYAANCLLRNKPTSMLAVYQLPSANGIAIAKKVRKLLEEEKKLFPPGVDYALMYDTTKFISASISEVVSTLVIAVILVIMVVFTFLQDWRSTIIPSIAIPVSLIGTFAVMLICGFTINLVTLFGLILAIGIVVDDAIVVIENVNRLMEEEKLSPKEATIKCMEQVTSPIVATTLVLMAVFIPVSFLPGISGELYRQFALTIAISVGISSINALTLSPALCSLLLKPVKSKPFILFRLFNRFFDWLTVKYVSVSSFFIKRGVLVVILFAVLMGITYKIYTVMPTGFVPEEDQGYILVDIQLPDDASLQRSSKVAEKAANMISDCKGVSDVLIVNGYSMLSSTTASNSTFLVVILAPWSKRQSPELHQNAILAKINGELATIPSAQIMPFPLPAIPGIGTTGGFEYVLQDTMGNDPRRLAQAMHSLIAKANQSEAITTAYSIFRANVPQVFLKIDREKVKKLGIDLNDVFVTLQSCMGQNYINDFNKYGKIYQVKIQAKEDYRRFINDIRKLFVRNRNNEMVPLSTILSTKKIFGPQFMNRYNMFSSATINGSPAPGHSSGDAMNKMEELSEMLPDGMKFSWTGMSYQEKLAGNIVILIFALALTFIYLFLVAQYESWMIPLSVMLSVPIAFFGSISALFFMGLNNNIYTQIGFVLLFGLACKTAILIVEFAKEKHEKGDGIEDAAVFAAKLRFRAVCMTAISFILGVFPLVIAVGAGAASRRSLGTAVFGGMLVAGTLGTIIVPAFYAVIQKITEWTTRGSKN